MNILFVIIGFIFDIIIFCIAILLTYTIFNQDVLLNIFNLLTNLLSKLTGKLQVGVVSFILFLFSFRTLLLLFGRKKEKEFTISKGAGGVITISYASIEKAIRKIVAERTESEFSKISIKFLQNSISLKLKIKVNLLNGSVTEFTDGIAQILTTSLKDSFGIEVKKVDIQIEQPKDKGKG